MIVDGKKTLGFVELNIKGIRCDDPDHLCLALLNVAETGEDESAGLWTVVEICY